MEVEESISKSPAISTTTNSKGSSSSSSNSNSSSPSNNSNSNNNNNNASTTITSTTVKSPAKRSNKPLMERRRRARINNCLLQLKCLLLQDMKREENSHVSKFEKAEILEMTVQKLKKIRDWIQLQEAEVSSKEQGFREHPRYKAGFNDCMNEVVRYLSIKDCGNNEFQSRVMSHLNHCYKKGSLVSTEAATKPGSVSSSDDMETNFGIRTYDHHPPPPPPPPHHHHHQHHHRHQPDQSQIQTQTTTSSTLSLTVPQPDEHLSGSKCAKQFPVIFNKQYDCPSSVQQTTNSKLNNNANKNLTSDLSPSVVANGEMAAVSVATSTPKGLFQPVNIITDSIPKLVNNQHAVQLDTNISEPNCKAYVHVVTQNSSVNGQEMMETLPTRTTGSSMTQVTASTNTLNIDEISQRHAGQIITGIDYYNNKSNIIFSNNNSGGTPIAFLVATPLPVKAIPLYTSLDKTQETCVGVLSPHATNIKSNTTTSAEVPPHYQSLNVADSSILKTDVTNIGHSYRMSNRGDNENKFVTSSNVWRPWNAVE